MGELERADVNGISVAFRQLGAGAPVVLLHGWPTSSYLWREIMPALAAAGRWAIAPDLPGFGCSDAPPAAPYTLDFHARVLDGFLAALAIERPALALHDLGGPVGLLWAVRQPARLERLALLDTIVYPGELPVLRGLLRLLGAPGVGPLVLRPTGVRLLLRLGVRRLRGLDPAARTAYLAPFATPRRRQVLLQALLAPRSDEFEEIQAGLDRLEDVPTLIAWATHDLLLPRSELRRLALALPAAETRIVDRAGHLLQEERAEQVAALLADFLRVGAGAGRAEVSPSIERSIP